MSERFEVQTQVQSLWCWAAVASSVDEFFAGSRRFEQCGVAKNLLGEDCCNPANAGGPTCNSPQHLDDAFASISRPVTFIPAPLPFARVKQELDAGRPICARIHWRSGGGHFVVVCGYRESRRGRQLLLISDPHFPDSILQYRTFLTAYHTVGEWVESFVMEAPQ